MSLLRWPHVALEMGAGAHFGLRRAARWAGVWSTLAALEEQILDAASAPRTAGHGKETVGDVFSQDRFRQGLVKQRKDVRKGPWSSLSSYRCRRWQNSWWM